MIVYYRSQPLQGKKKEKEKELLGNQSQRMGTVRAGSDESKEWTNPDGIPNVSGVNRR